MSWTKVTNHPNAHTKAVKKITSIKKHSTMESVTTKRHHTATAYEMKWKEEKEIRRDNIYNALKWGLCAGETEKNQKI